MSTSTFRWLILECYNIFLKKQMMSSDSEGEQVVNEVRQQTEDVKSKKYHSFNQFGLKQDLILGMGNLGFKEPTPIQEESIPLIIGGKSIIARAKNGTGKTGAFLIPIINEINTKINTVQALILVPTRELAIQIQQLGKAFAKFLNVNISLLIGGNSTATEDINKLQNDVHIIVGTTGRVKQVIRRKPSILNDCRFFVLDEADKLLSQDFQIQIEEILQKFKKQPQLLMYSATFPITIKSFKQKYMPKAEVLNMMDELMLLGLTHYYILVDERDKVKALNTIYSKLIIHQCIIFCGSFQRVQMLSNKLREKGYQNLYLHSKMSPVERTKVFNKFKSGEVKTLVCSDLCARGIDIQSVNVVINFDFPKQSETYLHRIGRSGRFGQIGLAINLITERDQENVIKIEKELETEIDSLPAEVDAKLYT